MSERTYVMLCVIRVFVKYTRVYVVIFKTSCYYNSIFISPFIIILRTLPMIIRLVLHRTSIICLYPFIFRYVRSKQCPYWINKRCSRVIVVCQFTYTNQMIIVHRTVPRIIFTIQIWLCQIYTPLSWRVSIIASSYCV